MVVLMDTQDTLCFQRDGSWITCKSYYWNWCSITNKNW